MQELRDIPSLDFLKGFDAAARHLSFTLAADELFLTQSALSRQIKSLEGQIGKPLFLRGHRSLTLTPAGLALQPVVRGVLAELGRVVDGIRARSAAPRVSVSTTVPFASLWLIPRLPKFRAANGDVDVFVSADNRMVELGRGSIDLAVRFLHEQRAPPEAVRLFGEDLVPVVSPSLVGDRKRPLRRLEDLANHVLLHLEDPLGRTPWVNWDTWLASAGLRDLVPAGNLRFSQYDLLLQAAVSGQGVALGRSPLIDHALARGELVTPFPRRHASPRGYFVLCGSESGRRSEVAAFVAWLREEAAPAAEVPPAAAGAATLPPARSKPTPPSPRRRGPSGVERGDPGFPHARERRRH